MDLVIEYSALDVIQFMTRSDLQLYKKKGSKAPLHKRVEANKGNRKKGVVFVSPSKDHLMQGQGYVVTSYETLHDKCNNLTHWTPNTYRGGTYYDFKKRVIKGHTRNNLKQINTFGFDIDTKDVDLYALFLGCDEAGLPRPNVLLETPRGYQFFMVLETPFYVTNKHNYKSLRVADRIAENMANQLKEYAPIDVNCSPFGFYRIPNDSNIRYFNADAAHTGDLISWSINYEKEHKKGQLYVVHNHRSIDDQTTSDWYKALIRSKHIDKGHYASSRNNALLTLAIANYASGVDYDDAYDELDIFNSTLYRPLSKNEFDRTIESAYSGRYKGPKRSYVESLLENWVDDDSVKFKGKEGWYKFAKPREERVRSHYHEREDDIIKYLSKHTSPKKPFLEGSIRILAETLGMAKSTLQAVFKRSKKIYKRTVGRGRAAITMIATRSMLIKSILQQKKQDKKLQMSFSPSTGTLKDNEGYYIPSLDELLRAHNIDLFIQSRAGPPNKVVI